MLQAKCVSKRIAFRLGEVRFYMIMVGLNVSLQNVHTDTRVCLTDDDRSNGYTHSHTNREVIFGFVK